MRLRLALVAGLAAAPLALGQPAPNSPCPSHPLVQESYRVFRPSADVVQLVTLNMAEETDVGEIRAEIDRLPLLGDAAVLALQEVMDAGEGAGSMPRNLAKSLQMDLVYAPGDRLSGASTRGLAILSRYRIRDAKVIPLPHNDLHFKSRCRIALAATIDGPFGPFRLWNLHFDSRINAERRLRQLEAVLADASGENGPKVIAGDLNTGNVFWINHLVPLPYLHGQSQAVCRALGAQGFSTPFCCTGRTFDYLPVKLDWIYVRDLAIRGHSLSSVAFSDHRALAVTVVQDDGEPAQEIGRSGANACCACPAE